MVPFRAWGSACAAVAVASVSSSALAGGPHTCCWPEGYCQAVSDCATCGGVCHENQNCLAIHCVAGACCSPGGDCEMLTDDACAGDYQGDNTTCSPNPCPQPPACPDGACNGAEDRCSCPADCADDPNSCSDCECSGSGGNCECDADCVDRGDCCANACDECGSCNSACGNGICGLFEDCSFCPDDCLPCGDGICDPSNCEDCASCPDDCLQDCGDDLCEGCEDCDNCSSDCACLAPTNDTCDNAESLDIGGSATVNNTEAGDDASPECVSAAVGRDAWYAVVGNGETLTATTCNPSTGIDTVIKVFCECGATDHVTCNDDDGSCGFPSTVSWCSEPGHTYYIAVGSYFGVDRGNIELSVTADGSACSPAACPRPGACCDSLGGCEDTNSADCEVSFFFPDVACADISCPPRGACCFPDGACFSDVDIADCRSPGELFVGEACDEACVGACCAADGCTITMPTDCGGAFQGFGATCDSNPCDGACCGGSFLSCTVTGESSCTAGGGAFAGAGTTCDTHPCTGACCEESCQVLTQAECDAEGIGYTYLGDGTTCDASTCQGGCCELDGSCMDGLFDRLDCANQAGVFIGPGTTCTEELCAPLTAQACCFDDGSCQELPKIACEDQGGGSVDGVTECADADCPQPEACCFADGTCQELVFVRCDDAGGLNQGLSSTCSPNPCEPAPANDACESAIEVTAGGSVTADNQFARDDVTNFCGQSPAGNGVWYKVVGNGEVLTVTTCNPGTDFDTLVKVFCNCETMACVGGSDDDPNCSPSSTVTWCSEPGETYYFIVGGFAGQRGNFELSVTAGGAACSSPACQDVTYACCVVGGGCEEMPPEQCEGSAGLPQEAGSTCFTAFCPQERGACCDGTTCYDDEGDGIPESDCLDIIHGAYLGHGTTCTTDSCATPTGACCLPNGICTTGTQVNCRGDYQGDSTSCTAQLCPQPSGACCLADESCMDNLAPGVCTSQGVYQGHDSSCSSVNCSGEPTGACCQSDAACAEATEGDCTGAYLGDKTTCEPNACLGACCTRTGCVEMPQMNCADPNVNGVFHGIGSTCDPVNPCLVNVGACCEDGFLCKVLPQLECFGPFQGVDTTCDPDPCPHACCFADGSCAELGESDCSTQGGALQSVGSRCDPNSCPQPTGACCGADPLSCTVGTEADCSGVYAGDGTDCTTTPCAQTGACCSPATACSNGVLIGHCTAGTFFPGGLCDNIDLTSCEPIAPGACCSLSAPCYLASRADCILSDDAFQGPGTTCDGSMCVGACCHGSSGVTAGSGESGCQELTAPDCRDNLDGDFKGFNTECEAVACPVAPMGACCAAAACIERTQSQCATAGGVYKGDGTTCEPTTCQATGACCYENVDFAPGSVVANTGPALFCAELTAASCAARNGAYSGDGTVCESDTCHGACCLDGEPSVTAGDQNYASGCVDLPVVECRKGGGTFQGPGTSCDQHRCAVPRVSAGHKGSLLMYSKVELRWLQGGALRQDTIIELTNDYAEEVCVQLYFVNGDRPLDPVRDPVTGGVIVEGEPGWDWVDCQFCLTPDQTTYWSAATGLPAGCQPFTVLDPSLGNGPGRPDLTVPGERHLRGFVYAWAVDQQGHAISWNHLSGGATIANYLNSNAWDYNAWAFQAHATCMRVCDDPGRCEDPRVTCTPVAQGERIGESSRLRLDGREYDAGFDMLLMDFFASGSTALSIPGTVTTLDTDLTLHPITADLRQDSIGPVTTKAEFAVWNEEERRFSGTTRCITCWDQTLLSLYAAPNHFLLRHLQTDKGKTRIDGVRSDVCDLHCVRGGNQSDSLGIDFILDILGINHVCSFDASMLGVAAKTLAFSGGAMGRTTAGRTLVGMGTQDGWIKWDIVAPPGTAQVGIKPSGSQVKSPAAERSTRPPR